MSAETLLSARSHITGGEVRCILVERGIPAPQLALLTAGLETAVGELDSLGSGLKAGAALYPQLMEHTAQVIKDCVGQGIEKQPILPPEEERPVVSSYGIGGSFLLSDHLGGVVSEAKFLGRYNLLYFGYTFCPDVCPTSLQVMSAALELLGSESEKIQPWFITVDPERDSVSKINRYVRYFNKNLIGLTGSPEMISRIAARYRVRYEKVQGEDPAMYLMDHTASLFLIGPDGRFITKFAHGITPRALAERLKSYL